jgi:hypothetical protein
MVRLEELSRSIRAAAPDAYAPAYEAVTTFGDTVTVLFVVTLVYWIGTDRRSVAVAMGYSLVALSLVLVLKGAFGYPRPPESAWLIETEGLGFPSGHATAAAVVYGGLAHAHGWWDRPKRIVPVAILVGAVGLSRVVLGVHYLADVLVGFTLGLTVVVVVSHVSDGHPRRAFALASLCALEAVLVSSDPYASVALGGSIGGLLATARYDLVPEQSSSRETALAVAVGGAALAPTAAGLAVDATPGVVVGVANAVTVAGVVLAPAAAERLDAAGEDAPAWWQGWT